MMNTQLQTSIQTEQRLLGALVLTFVASVTMLTLAFLSKPYRSYESIATYRAEERVVQQKFPEELRYVHGLVNSVRGKKNQELSREVAFAIVKESASAGVDPLLVASIIRSESTFNPKAVSNRGAHGLMQIQGATGAHISDKNDFEWKGKDHLLNDSRYNVRLGIAYLQELQKRFNGNLEHALIAYNWGPTKLSKALKNKGAVPKESKIYAQKILARHQGWRLELEGRIAQNLQSAPEQNV